jgi:hypothetical protein
MHSEETQRDSEETQREAASLPEPDGPPQGRTRISRRQAIGHMSAVAAAGAAAWVMPEILTAKPAAGATLSGPVTSPATDGPATTGASGTGGVTSAAATTNPLTALASTGLNLQRDAEVGAVLVAGGWALQHWASRTPKPAADGVTEARQGGSAGGPV